MNPFAFFRSAPLAALALGAFFGCSSPEASSTGVARSAIVGGEADTEHDAVMQLLSFGEAGGAS